MGALTADLLRRHCDVGFDNKNERCKYLELKHKKFIDGPHPTFAALTRTKYSIMGVILKVARPLWVKSGHAAL
jgi:hypothetical protein